MLKLFFIISLFVSGQNILAQNPVNWTTNQLIKPSALAMMIVDQKTIPILFSVGPAATIPHSINIGMVKDEANLQKFKKELENLPKETKIVVYCGCCPFEHCPNVRPAIAVLKKMEFTNYYLLNLPDNIKKDWLDKGYPAEKL